MSIKPLERRRVSPEESRAAALAAARDLLTREGAAAVTLQASMGLVTTGRAGVCFKAVDAGVFDELVRETEELLQATSAEAGTTVSRHADEFGFSWIVIHDPDVEDLATTSHVISLSLEDRGFSERSLNLVIVLPYRAKSLVTAETCCHSSIPRYKNLKNINNNCLVDRQASAGIGMHRHHLEKAPI